MKFLNTIGLIISISVITTPLLQADDDYIFNAKYRQRLAKLVKKYKWAQEEKKKIIDLADKIAAKSDEKLWLSVLPQSIPRALYVNRKWGCPKCGKAIFKTSYYPWIKLHGQWKLQCPICKEKYPKNDFYKYYLSGIDETGTFNRAKADSRLLYNTEHPDPADPLHKFGVDDGRGYIVSKDKHYRFIAHYNLFTNWYGRTLERHYATDRLLDKALALGYAYAFTENPVYAEKAGVILDRFADLYPDYDMQYWAKRGRNFWACTNSEGTTGDSTWSSINGQLAAAAYGLIYDGLKDNKHFYAFLKKQASCYKLPGQKGSLEDFTANFEKNYMARELACFKSQKVVGNTGFVSRSAMLMALTARGSKIRNELIDFLISPQLKHKSKKNSFDFHHIQGQDVFDEISHLTRDGFSWEGGYGYIAILPQSMTRNYIALKTLVKNVKDPVLKRQLETNVKLLKDRIVRFNYNACQTVCLGRYTPNFGDGGTFGVSYTLKGATPRDLGAACAAVDDDLLGKLYLAATAGGNQASALGNQLLDPFFDYAAFESRIAKVKAQTERYNFSTGSENMTGRGFVYLRNGAPDARRCMAIYYGSGGGHNQKDMGNINLFAYDTDLTPGLGYPDISKGHKRFAWHDNTISHNTVYANLRPQYVSPVPNRSDMNIGDQKLFAESPLGSIVDIDLAKAYPYLKASRRVCAMVNIDEKDFYAIDFFMVKGGYDHISSFHGSAGTTTHEGIVLTDQPKGTYAGPDIPYGGKEGKGLQYLADVRRGTLKRKAAVEWQIKDFRNIIKYGDKVRLRATSLTYEPQEFALAGGSPPQNIPDNPKFTTYMLRRTRGKNLETLFITVYESYLAGKRRVKQIKLLPRKQGGVFSAALEITMDNGQKDIIVKCAGESDNAVFAGNISLKGNLAIARYSKGQNLQELMIANASKLTLPHGFSWNGKASCKGKVADFDTGVKRPAKITLSNKVVLPENLALPLWADVQTTIPRIDANYKIISLKPDKSKTVMTVDAASFIAYRNNHTPSLPEKREIWASIAKKISNPEAKDAQAYAALKALIPLKNFSNEQKLQAEFNKLLKSEKLAKNSKLIAAADSYFIKKAMERGIENLMEKDLIRLNYEILSALFPHYIPAYPAFIYDFKQGAVCTIPYCYYFIKDKSISNSRRVKMKKTALSVGLAAACSIAGAGNLIKNGGAETDEKYFDGFSGKLTNEFKTGKKSYYFDGRKSAQSNEFIPVDTDKTYELSGWVKSIGKDSPRVLLGLIPFDSQKRLIRIESVFCLPDTDTVLAADAAKGATQIKIKNGASWIKAKYACVAFNTKKDLSDLPNRDLSKLGISALETKDGVTTVTLRSPLSKSYKAGVAVREHRAGGTYIYTAATGKYAPPRWTRYSGRISGIDTKNGNSPPNKFRKGTKYVKLFLEIYFRKATDSGKLAIDDLEFKEVPKK